MFTREGGADVSLRDVTIAQMGNGSRECGWRQLPEARGGFGGFWKSQLSSWLGRRRLTFACSPKPGQWPCGRCRTRWGGGRWKSQNRKNVYLSPYVEGPLNSKVIKSFVPELRSRVFRVSGFLCSMLWTFQYSCISMLHMDTLLTGVERAAAYLDDIIVVGQSKQDLTDRTNNVLTRIQAWFPVSTWKVSFLLTGN